MRSFQFDVAVIGAGAAGLMCAAVAGQGGKKVVLIDHSEKVAEKIRISGGGNCNFTNVNANHTHYLSDNPHFARSAMSAYTASDFIKLVQSHRIAYHEKHKGQLFCDEGAQAIIDMLLRECEAGQVKRWQPCGVQSVAFESSHYVLATDVGQVQAKQLVIATGGLSIPKIGATDFAYQIAKQFGLKRTDTRPALVPLTFDAWSPFVPMSGTAYPVRISCGKMHFDEDLLFTHRGLSGPAILQISSYWQQAKNALPLTIDLLPEMELLQVLQSKQKGSKESLLSVLKPHLSQKHLGVLSVDYPLDKKLADCSHQVLNRLATHLHAWTIAPKGNEGYAKAEVTLGGVSTDELNQHSLESKRQPGLYFIGECVDVTGWLGGYNFQWAWASAVAAGRVIAQF